MICNRMVMHPPRLSLESQMRSCQEQICCSRIPFYHCSGPGSCSSSTVFLRCLPLVVQMTLEEIADIDLVLNLRLREDVLIRKCVGRRVCGKCGDNYNVADIFEPAQNGVPEIVMPPLLPPPECASHMTIRADDTEEIVRRRLEIFRQEVRT